MKKVLVLGGTGAMGAYLVPLLAEKGYEVDVVALDAPKSAYPNLRYVVGDAKDRSYVESLLARGYDGIVDFMIYHRDRFEEWYPMLLGATDHYIYFSSYRVYANEEHPITEESPRLLDVSKDEELLASEDYSIYKAQGEDMLRFSEFHNWTIVRPAITYSVRRFQLVTLEMPMTVGRAIQGKKVLLPEEAKHIQGTMSWAGDVAQMLSAILFNPKAIGETYTLSTAEHRTWGEIAEYYRELIGMEVVWIPDEEYIEILGGGIGARRQLNYDRLFDRIVDNRKILALMGWKQEDLMPLYEGLKREIAQLPRELFDEDPDSDSYRRMDAWLAAHENV